MQAEIIAIGDEMTSGQRLDTNSQWLSDQLESLGIRVLYHTTVGDDLEANMRVFQIATDRANVVVATGGLGPTDDDLTRQAISAAFQRPLTLDEVSLAIIEERFRRRGRTMPEKNKIQAMFPEGANIIPNPHGTAPGIDLELVSSEVGTCRIFALPGVPIEMKEMWLETVQPAIRGMPTLPRRRIKNHVIKCFGVGESHMEAMLPDMIRRGKEPRVGITVHHATISLRITATGEDDDACDRMIGECRQQIDTALGELVFGTGDEELHDVVIRQLQESGKTVGVLETSTAGMLCRWLGEADPNNLAFRGATVLPANSFESTEEPGIITELIARGRQLRERLNVDFALVLGPIPPADADPDTPYHYGIIGPDAEQITHSTVAGHPEIHAPRMVKQALDLLRKHLRATVTQED